MEVDSVADEGRVVQQVEAALEVGHVAPGQQLLPQRGVFAAVTQLGVPETVHHHPRVVVELAERLAADVERLLETRQTHDEEGKEEICSLWSRLIYKVSVFMWMDWTSSQLCYCSV